MPVSKRNGHFFYFTGFISSSFTITGATNNTFFLLALGALGALGGIGGNGA